MFGNDEGNLPSDYGYGGDPSTFGTSSYGATGAGGASDPSAATMQAGVPRGYGVPSDTLATTSRPAFYETPPDRIQLNYGSPGLDTLATMSRPRFYETPPDRIPTYGATDPKINEIIEKAKTMPTVYAGSTLAQINQLRLYLGLPTGGAWDGTLTDRLYAAQKAAGLPSGDPNTTTELWVFLIGGTQGAQALVEYNKRKTTGDAVKSALQGALQGVKNVFSPSGQDTPTSSSQNTKTATPWKTYAMIGGGVLLAGGVAWYLWPRGAK
jgi:hypothetical protein